MSWVVQAVGKPPAVIDALAKQFATNQCSMPEEYVRQDAWKAIASALGAQDPQSVVKVTASGSMGYRDYTEKTGVFNSVTITVEPLHGFVE